MLQVEHLVIENVFHHIGRHTRMIENSADHNGIVCGIIVAQAVSGPCTAPGQLWPSEQAMKETPVEVLKNGLEIISSSLRGINPFSAPHLSKQVRLGANMVARNITSIPGRVFPLNALAIHLCQQNMGNRSENGLGRAFQQVRKPDKQPPFSQTDGVVDICKCEKLDRQVRDWGPRTQITIAFVEDLKKPLLHVAARLACDTTYFFRCFQVSSCSASNCR